MQDCLVETFASVDFRALDADAAAAASAARQQRAQQNLQHAAALSAAESVAPPWRFLSERHSVLEAECEAQFVAMAAWSDEVFLSPLTACDHGSPSASFEQHDMPLLLPVARAALRESAELAALYERLVPAKAHASAFWFCFFEHAQVIRRSTLPPTCIRSQSAEKRDAEDEWESFLASPLRVAR